LVILLISFDREIASKVLYVDPMENVPALRELEYAQMDHVWSSAPAIGTRLRATAGKYLLLLLTL
jgi:hypothetical protein